MPPSPKPVERPPLKPRLLEALEEGKKLGYIGGDSLGAQIGHSEEFGSCVEWALAQTTEDRSARGRAATAERPARPSTGRPSPRRFLDLGSGGGLPGLLLAARWEEASAVLLDSHQRKTDFLTRVVEACGWSGRVVVVRSRAEVAARTELRASFDVVVARGFGPPPVTAECSAPFLEEGGLLIVSEPPDGVGRELPLVGEREHRPKEKGPDRWPAERLAVLGLVPEKAWRQEFGFEILRQIALCPDRFPRREGIPRKRPLYAVGSV